MHFHFAFHLFWLTLQAYFLICHWIELRLNGSIFIKHFLNFLSHFYYFFRVELLNFSLLLIYFSKLWIWWVHLNSKGIKPFLNKSLMLLYSSIVLNLQFVHECKVLAFSLIKVSLVFELNLLLWLYSWVKFLLKIHKLSDQLIMFLLLHLI